MDPFIGEIRLFGFYFNPRGWVFCQGQLLPIAQHQALFSLLGTTYGGNGQQTFGVPDLRGRAAIGLGQGPGLSPSVWGELKGTENVTLLTTQMPAHTHIATTTTTLNASALQGTQTVPAAGNSLAAMVDTSVNKIFSYNNVAPTIPLTGASSTTTNALTGNNLPIPIIQPTIGMNYCISTEGVFPSRN